MHCILCHSSQIVDIQSISKATLSSLYRKNFGIDIERLLHTDLAYMHCQDCDLRFFACLDGGIPTGDNDFYNALNQLDWYYFDEKNEYSFAKDFIKENASVLEVGCGKGAFAKYIPQSATYTGLEFSTEAKTMAAKNGINIQNISIEDLALRYIKKSQKEKFDVACSFQVLEHVSDPHSFIASQIKVLKSLSDSTSDSTSNSDIVGGGGANRF